jgi:hypothetical protein
MFHNFYDTNMSHNTKEGLFFGCIAGPDLFVGSLLEIGLYFKRTIASNVDRVLPHQMKFRLICKDQRVL